MQTPAAMLRYAEVEPSGRVFACLEAAAKKPLRGMKLAGAQQRNSSLKVLRRAYSDVLRYCARKL